ncbi:MAG: hypothetical protein V1909_02995, partial [Candidatus Micrarchaeota archaeon]
ISNGINLTIQKYSSTGITNGTYFEATELRDPSNVFTADSPVIDSSALVMINVVPSTTGGMQLYFPSRQPYRIEMIPERGASMIIEGTTPSSYSLDLIELYP